MSNIYYNPNDFGLEIVEMVDLSDGCYQFDFVVVWKDKKGKLFWAQDSGCSCPTPFEDHTIESLERLHSRSWKYFEETVRGHYGFGGYGGEEFLQRVSVLVDASIAKRPKADAS